MICQTRKAVHRDAALLPEIEHSSGRLFLEWPGLEWIANDDVVSRDRHLHYITEGIALVAEVKERNLVGFLTGEIIEEGLHIWQVAVRAESQRKGVGRQLIDAAQEIAVTCGLTRMTLTTFRKVPWNQIFYERFGFNVLNHDALDQRLRDILDREAQAGLAPGLRCAMAKNLR